MTKEELKEYVGKTVYYASAYADSIKNIRSGIVPAFECWSRQKTYIDLLSGNGRKDACISMHTIYATKYEVALRLKQTADRRVEVCQHNLENALKTQQENDTLFREIAAQTEVVSV